MVLSIHTTIRLIRDGEMGGRGYGGGGRGRRVYTYRYTAVTTRMTCIKMGSADESHAVNVSL